MQGKSKALLLILTLILSGCELFEPMDSYSGSPGFGCMDPIAGTIERLGCNLVDDSDHCYQDAAVRLAEPEYCTGIENGPPRDKCYLRTSLRAENPKFCELIEEVPGGYSKAECYSKHAVMKGDKSLCDKITKAHSTLSGSWSKESCLNEISKNTEV